MHAAIDRALSNVFGGSTLRSPEREGKTPVTSTERKLDGVAGEFMRPGEEETIQRAIALVAKLVEEKAKAHGNVEPANHATLLGSMAATFRVLPDLDPELQVGMFKVAKDYPAWVQFSNADGVMSGRTGQDDFESVLRGVGIKVMNVEGERIDATQSASTQDFLMNNRPNFYWRNPNTMVNLLAIVGPPGIGNKLEALLDMLRRQTPVETYQLAKAIMAGLEKDRNDPNVIENPLTESYWSRLPVGFGAGRAMKYGMWPQHWGYAPPRVIEDYLASHPKPTYHPPGPPRRYLREVVKQMLLRQPIQFNFAVQLQTNPTEMPVEDEHLPPRWDPKKSPFRVVAQLLIPMQDIDRPGLAASVASFRFSPNNGLAEHVPLGGLNRVRVRMEKASQDWRGAPPDEPTPGHWPRYPR